MKRSYDTAIGSNTPITPALHPNTAIALLGQAAGALPAQEGANHAPIVLTQSTESGADMAAIPSNRSDAPAKNAAASQPAFRPESTTTLNAITPLTTATSTNTTATATTTTTAAYSPPSSLAMALNTQPAAQRASQLASLCEAIERNDPKMLSQALEAISCSGENMAQVLNLAQVRTLPGIGKRMLTPLMLAAWLGREGLVNMLINMLIKAGAQVDLADTYGTTALMLAALSGEIDTVRALIKAFAKVNQASTYGMTALMRAAQYGHTPTVQALIDAGANVNQADTEGVTALILAAQNDYTPTVQALIDAGANINQADTNGETALMGSAEEGQTATVQALIDAGANVNQVNVNGDTALILAAQNGQIHTVQVLIKAGADISIVANVDSLKLTALGSAIMNGHARVVELLARYGLGLSTSQPGMMATFGLAFSADSCQVLQALFDAGLDLTPQQRNTLRQRDPHASPALQQLLATGRKSMTARIYDAHQAGQHKQANLLIEELLRSHPRHPLGLAPCATWLAGSGKTWTLAPGPSHAMASLLAGHDLQRIRLLASHGLRSEVVAAIVTTWDTVASAAAHLAKLTAAGRIRIAGAAPKDALFAFALLHSEPLLQLLDAKHPNCSSDPIVTLQAQALLQANADHAPLTLDGRLDPEAALVLLGEDMPELLRLWLLRQVDAQR
jgi:ankyrin repeat protein